MKSSLSRGFAGSRKVSEMVASKSLGEISDASVSNSSLTRTSRGCAAVRGLETGRLRGPQGVTSSLAGITTGSITPLLGGEALRAVRSGGGGLWGYCGL